MFLQIGNLGINVDQIESISIKPNEESVIIYMISDTVEPLCVLEDNRYKAFMDWWGNKAEVYKAL